MSDPARKVVLVGANPALQLFDGDTVTAYASMWRVDWSIRGRGTAVVLWHEGQVLTVGDDAALAAWLADHFVRHFPEVDGRPWPDPVHTDHPVTVDIDLATGARVDAGPVQVELSGVLDLREFTTDDFPLAGVPHRLRLVVAPCATATLTLANHPLPGTIRTTPHPHPPHLHRPPHRRRGLAHLPPWNRSRPAGVVPAIGSTGRGTWDDTRRSSRC